MIGLVAAYNRGRLDNVLMRPMDILLAFPTLLLALVAVTTLGRKSWVIVLIVAFTAIPRVARVTRGAALGVVERDFIGAAEALGESRTRILRSEMLPNVAGPLLVEASLRLTYSIILIGSLGFLGFGIGLNEADWAQMINENRPALSTQPWGTMLPIFAIGAAHRRRRADRRRPRPRRRRHRPGEAGVTDWSPTPPTRSRSMRCGSTSPPAATTSSTRCR